MLDMAAFRRRATAWLIVLFGLLQGLPLSAQVPQVKETVLDNGLKVLLLEEHKSPAVTFQVWYRVGSRNEEEGKTGLSHFLEHMAGPKDYSKIIARHGGRSNAFTMADATVYFATMSRDQIDIAIELEASRMGSVLLDGAQFEAEKKVIMEERRLTTEDDPVSALIEVMNGMTYTAHPYRRPVIGWMTDIENLSREDLEAHYRTYYVPNNAFIVAVGDFSAPEMLAKIRKAFGGITRGPEPPPVKIEETPQKGEKRISLKKEAELPFLALSYHAPTITHPDSYALDILSVILAEGESARLYRELVYDKRLAHTLSAGYWGLSIDSTTFTITAQVMPGTDRETLARAIDALLDQVRSEPVSERELEKAKNQVMAGFVFGQDSVFAQAMRIGYYESAAGWRLYLNYLIQVTKVSTGDVLRVAQKYLDPDRRTVGVLVPVRQKEP